MKLTLIILLALIVVGFIAMAWARRSSAASQSIQHIDGGAQELRTAILTRSLFAGDPESTNCAVIDYGVKAGCATLVACGDGAVSVYYSNGGGILGLGVIETVRKTALSFLDVAASFRGEFSKAEEFPLPHEGEMIFYWVDSASSTWSSGPIPEKALQKRQHPLHPLAYSAQDVFTKIRQNS